MNEKVNDYMKNHLADTLKKLSREKDLEKISVGDIVKAGNVNRSTFYYYFKHKDDLIRYIFEHDVICRYVPAKNDGNWIENTRRRLQALHRDRPFYLQTLELNGGSRFYDIFFQAGYSLSRHFIDHYLEGRELDEASKDFIAAFYANAAAAMSAAFTRNGCESPEEETLRFFDVVEPGLQHAIDRSLRRYQDKGRRSAASAKMSASS